MKQAEGGDFGAAWGGIASLQITLPVVWTEARHRGLTSPTWLRGCRRAGPPRRPSREGRDRVGKDADLCILAPDEPFTVEPHRLHHRNPGTPYAGAP